MTAANRQRFVRPRRGFIWRGLTPQGQRFYGLDFGRFAVGVLASVPPLDEGARYDEGHPDSPGVRGTNRGQAADRRMEEQSYWQAAASERPGPLRRRRQMKWLREFEDKYGPSERLRGLIGV